jgi:predicted NAD/FAD-dependent oxidoreductase
MSKTPSTPKHFAIIGAGMAGITCARTLVQAGHRVTVFEKSRGLGGRMATRDSAFGSFDHGTQYFTARDPRFVRAMETTPKLCKRWSANSLQVLDELGHVKAVGLSKRESHWVGAPGMKSLVVGWAEPLITAGMIHRQTRVIHIDTDVLNSKHWQLHTESLDGSQHVFSGFDAVLLAIPCAQGLDLLQNSKLAAPWVKQIGQVKVAPCWTLMLAFPQAMQPGMSTFGPQWNAALSTHHRIAWLARESSKPGRDPIERWTVQASPAWSQEHLHDDPTRAQAKLLKAFTEVTGIRAEPAHIDSQRWLYAKTLRPLGKSHLWDSKKGLGMAGDWCLGHRVEDAFVSGLELALAAA